MCHPTHAARRIAAIASTWPGVLLACAWCCDAPASDAPAWVAVSNQRAQDLIHVIGKYAPETASFNGFDAFDDEIYDLRRDRFEEHRRDLEQMLERYRREAKDEDDPRVRQDMTILADAAAIELSDLTVERRHFLPFENVAELIFGVVQTTLDPRIPRARQQHLVTRLKRYSGLAPGYRPITDLAEQQLLDRLQADPRLQWPYRGEVERVLNDSETLTHGFDGLMAASGLEGWQEAVARLDAQLRDYSQWIRETVLPHARADYRLPAEVYAERLRHFGIHEEPHALIRDALTAFADIQVQMQGVAEQISAGRGFANHDYRHVIAELKKDVIAPDHLLELYQNRLHAIESIVREHDIVTLPTRAASIRLASAAENAQTPAPHMVPGRLVGNSGEYGEFVLSTGMSPSESGKPRAFDDFSHQAASWSLTAHEARPGHELQFAKIIEAGVSIARAIFAFNSANVEGWGLYSEAEIQPYEPLDGQLFALQMRAHRIARAFLDPMVNLGEISLADAKAVLTRDIGLSDALATSEVERYSFRMPGQAGSYFYGYQRLLEVRARAELSLGARFNRRAFNDFVLDQGLVTPELLAMAVKQQFIPGEEARNPATAQAQDTDALRH